jgi:hypothetical protein
MTNVTIQQRATRNPAKAMEQGLTGAGVCLLFSVLALTTGFARQR